MSQLTKHQLFYTPLFCHVLLKLNGDIGFCALITVVLRCVSGVRMD